MILKRQITYKRVHNENKSTVRFHNENKSTVIHKTIRSTCNTRHNEQVDTKTVILYSLTLATMYRHETEFQHLLNCNNKSRNIAIKKLSHCCDIKI